MFRLGKNTMPLGCWLLFVPVFLAVGIGELVSNSYLLQHGVTTRGVILGEGRDVCQQSGDKSFSVQFTDQSGHEHIGTISQCEHGDFNATTGESVTIVYDPNDPTTLEPLNSLKAGTTIWPIYIIVVGLITLILLFFWIRKQRMRKGTQLSTHHPGSMPWWLSVILVLFALVLVFLVWVAIAVSHDAGQPDPRVGVQVMIFFAYTVVWIVFAVWVHRDEQGFNRYLPWSLLILFGAIIGTFLLP